MSSEQGEVLEVTHDKKVVWTFHVDRFIATAKRYSADQLTFLDGHVTAR